MNIDEDDFTISEERAFERCASMKLSKSWMLSTSEEAVKIRDEIMKGVNEYPKLKEKLDHALQTLSNKEGEVIKLRKDIMILNDNMKIMVDSNVKFAKFCEKKIDRLEQEKNLLTQKAIYWERICEAIGTKDPLKVAKYIDDLESKRIELKHLENGLLKLIKTYKDFVEMPHLKKLVKETKRESK